MDQICLVVPIVPGKTSRLPGGWRLGTYLAKYDD